MSERSSLVGWAACLVLALLAAPGRGTELTQYVRAYDGVSLATDIYLPNGNGPWPVVLTRTPYNRKDPGHYSTWCRTLAQHGYACVAQDCRGRFDSGGQDTVFRDDAADGRATLEWIAQQRWCNGSIASAGGSAMGITGYAMTPGAPAALKCLVAPMATPNIYHHVFSQGGAVRWELISNWLAGQGDSSLLEGFLTHRLEDDWWDALDFVPEDEPIAVKALHFGGWYDMYIQGPLDGFSHYREHGDENARDGQHVVIGPWYHFSLATGWMAQTYPGDRNTGQFSFPDNAFPGGWPFGGDPWELLLDWLGYCLCDEPTAASSWPPVRVYLMGAVGESGAPGNVWVDLQEWPPDATEVPYYLSAQGELLKTPPPGGELTLEIDPLHPVPTLGGANHFGDLVVDGRPMGFGPYDQRPVEARDDVLTFTSTVLARPVTVMGRVRLRTWLRPDTRDLDISVRLTDVYPDGRSMLVLDGIQRARMRCADDRECFLDPGAPVEIDVDLWSTAIVFNAGHRIRVDVAGTNSPRFEVNPNDGGNLSTSTPIVARPALLFGASYPTSLVLPEVPLPSPVRRRLRSQ